MPGRNWDISSYRYGYQGSEMDNEVKGEGNHYTTEFRQLDPRLGRWFSVDPLAAEFPWQSPYVSMDCDPVNLTDVRGLSTKKEDPKDGDLKTVTTTHANGTTSETTYQYSKKEDKWVFYTHAPVLYETYKEEGGTESYYEYSKRKYVERKVKNGESKEEAEKSFDTYLVKESNYFETIDVEDVKEKAVSTEKTAIDLSDDYTWKKQKPRKCHTCATEIAEDGGVDSPGLKKNNIQMGNENKADTKIIPTDKVEEGIKAIDDALEKGDAIVVGVNHTFYNDKNAYNEGTTDHYVVVIGRGYDTEKKQNYYIFYEVGTSHKSIGTSDQNRLYYDPKTKLATGYTQMISGSGKKKFYTLTQVRKNGG